MPTDKLWLGTDSGNEGDASVADNYSPSGVPSGGDSLFFLSGSQAVTAGLSTLASIDLVNLVFGPGYSGKVAGSGGSFQVGDVTNLLYNGAGSECWVQPTAITLGQIVGGLSGSDNMLQITDGGSLAITDLEVSGGRGTVTVDAASLGSLIISTPAALNGNTSLGVEIADGLTPTTVECDSGAIILNSGATNLRAFGFADVTVNGSAAMSVLLAAMNAIVRYRSSGNVTATDIWGPSAEVTTEQNPTAGTVTFATVNANAGGVFRKSGLGNVVITNEITRGGGLIAVAA